jgi:hypothetical protein
VSWFSVWLGALEVFVVLAVLLRGTLWLVGVFLLTSGRYGVRLRRREAELRTEADALRREAAWALAALPAYPAPPGQEGEPPPHNSVASSPVEPLSVEELYRIASEGLDKRPSKLPSDGEGKIR